LDLTYFLVAKRERTGLGMIVVISVPNRKRRGVKKGKKPVTGKEYHTIPKNPIFIERNSLEQILVSSSQRI
jgi:hypothetical protein